MNQIQPNSNKYKESLEKAPVAPTPKLKPIIAEGKARTKKKSGLSKVAGSIISEDAQNVKSYIITDVLIPSAKKAISDIVTNGIDIILYGETGHTKRSNAGRVSYINYNDTRATRSGGTRYDSRDPRDRVDTTVNRRSVSAFEDVEVDTMGEAKDIISRMSEYLEAYPVISIAELYDLANIRNFPHTFNNYGWKSVVDFDIVPTKNGYLIKTPPVEPIK